jgi:S-adenosylmethionine hydrolase
MIVLFTDFGGDDIYVAQVKAVLHALAPGTTVLDLLHSAPSFRVEASAHLLAALSREFPAGTVFLAVVDPGVGTAREAIVVEADGRWYVGPDNGLLSIVAARASSRRAWRIVWRPERLSASFHGRDLFAPIVAAIARDGLPHAKLEPSSELAVQVDAGDLREVVYVDHYGNLLTGVRASAIPAGAELDIRGVSVRHARVFADVPVGALFWYENSIGLVEVAANGASARKTLGASIGDNVAIER